jgi:hypothetical protein
MFVYSEKSKFVTKKGKWREALTYRSRNQRFRITLDESWFYLATDHEQSTEIYDIYDDANQNLVPSMFQSPEIYDICDDDN